MKILLANKYFHIKGGAENSFFQTAALLREKEHEISFFSMKHPRNFSSEYDKYFISNVDYEDHSARNIIKASGRILYSFEAKKKISQLVEDEKPDLVHLNNIYHQISPSILHSIKKQKIPIVMSLRDYKLVCTSYSMFANDEICEECANKKYYSCFLKKCVKDSRSKSLLNAFEMYLHHKMLHIYDLVDAFISPSNFLIKKVNEMGFKRRIEYLPNFVDLKDFTPCYEHSERSVCYVGRLSKEKGIETLMNAVKGVDIHLKIIGDGPLMETLMNKKNTEKFHNITFLGFKSGDEIKNETRNTMAVVVPSEWYENNPRSAIEAFASGKPVIGSRIGGISELVRDNETGLTFESGDVGDLREKIQYMLDNPSEVRRMGQNARVFVEQELNTEKHYRRLMEIYNSVLNK